MMMMMIKMMMMMTTMIIMTYEGVSLNRITAPLSTHTSDVRPLHSLLVFSEVGS